MRRKTRKVEINVTLIMKKIPVTVEYEHFNLRRRAVIEVSQCDNHDRTMRRAENLLRRQVGPDSLKILHTSMAIS